MRGEEERRGLCRAQLTCYAMHGGGVKGGGDGCSSMLLLVLLAEVYIRFELRLRQGCDALWVSAESGARHGGRKKRLRGRDWTR